MAAPGTLLTPAQAAELPAIPNNKTGNLFTTIGHIFCAVVGAGVLGLPNAVGWWGWIAGPVLLFLFYVVSLWTSQMLASVYRVGDTEYGRFYRAVFGILGKNWGRFSWVLQLINLILFTLAYTITGSQAMKEIAVLIGSPFNKQWYLVLVLGAMEVVLSQIPNLEECWWVSAIGAIGSLTYCSIAFILGCIFSHNGEGTLGGIEGNSSADKALNMLSSLGSIAFAYTFSLVLLEIQDTLKQPPNAMKTMRKAINIAVTGAGAFYILIACTGYAALGSMVPGNVINGFPDAPKWVVIVANLAIAAHMVTAIQVFAQPIFHTGENVLLARKYKKERAMRRTASSASNLSKSSDKTIGDPVDTTHGLTHLPSIPPSYECPHPHTTPADVESIDSEEAAHEQHKYDRNHLPWIQRFIIRTGYCAFMCIIGIVMPFFKPFIGLAGSLIFWPLCVLLPCLMFIKIYQPTGTKLMLVKLVNVSLAIVSAGALVGSCRDLVVSWSNGFTLFQ